MGDRAHPQKNLLPDQIVKTITRLGMRIHERFPGSSLSTLCTELREVSKLAKARSEQIRRPIVALRLAVALLVVVIVIGVVGTIVSLERTQATGLSLTDFIQLLEAGINDIVLIGAGIFFLVTFETRIKRNRALVAIHELRSFAHIIDMHQLTKDMTRMEVTASSPERLMTPAQLERYLDYCSEMLSLVGKVAALYIQHFNDGVAIAAVTEVENLTTGLSRKIWQKITLIENHITRLQDPGRGGPALAGQATSAMAVSTEQAATAKPVAAPAAEATRATAKAAAEQAATAIAAVEQAAVAKAAAIAAVEKAAAAKAAAAKAAAAKAAAAKAAAAKAAAAKTAAEKAGKAADASAEDAGVKAGAASPAPETKKKGG